METRFSEGMWQVIPTLPKVALPLQVQEPPTWKWALQHVLLVPGGGTTLNKAGALVPWKDFHSCASGNLFSILSEDPQGPVEARQPCPTFPCVG
jgi:hypothetical protein